MKLSSFEKQIILAIATISGVGQKTLDNIIKWQLETDQSLKDCWQKNLWPDGLFASKAVYEKVLEYKAQVGDCLNLIEEYQKRKIEAVFVWESRYPRLLKEAAFPPPIIYCLGKMNLLASLLTVAVVGTRRMTLYGKRVTSVMSRQLVSAGATVVSGFMYGVDVTAHLVAIEAGGGSIAVLGFGFDQMYPKSQTELFKQLLNKNMLFISQFPPGTPARPGNFLQRNRIVAGLSHAILVTEAGYPSGSFSTAQAALDEGRLVCSVPGPFDSQYSQGTKWLINEGALLVTSGYDLVEELGFPYSNKSKLKPVAQNNQDSKQIYERLTKYQKIVFDTLLSHECDIDLLAKLSNLSTSILYEALTNLELEGLIIKSGESWRISL